MLIKLNMMLFLILWVKNLMMTLMYYNIIYLCLLYYRDWIKGWFFIVFRICYCTSCTSICKCALVCWYVVVHSYGCTFDVGSIWSSYIFSVMSSLICIYFPISLVADPYSWELMSCGTNFNGYKVCFDTYFIPITSL
jgi:hypothetical protein